MSTRLFSLWAVACAVAPALQAKPLFLKQARAAGMAEVQDCQACHVERDPKGGPWNARGTWLRTEKNRRHAMAVDVSWLKDYPLKPDGTSSK